MTTIIAPHGGKLVNREISSEAKPSLQEQAPGLKKILLNSRQVSDVEMIATGGFSPLEGFMTKKDYDTVLSHMRLTSGLPWTIPITLAVTEEEAAPLREGQNVSLVDRDGAAFVLLHLEEKFTYDKKREAEQVYRTTDAAHPGVKALLQQGNVLLGGQVSLLQRPRHTDFLPYRLAPAETRRLFAEKGWRTVVGFQTRNPVHRAHEYIQKCALEVVDGLFLHPLVGETKGDDIPADVRMKCYEILLERYYPRERVLLGVLPAAMRYAGPREAIFHAIIRKNYGCSHFIVGRDHAGVGNYYGPYDAHHIFSQFGEGELGITPMFFDHTFFCRRCGNMASSKTCPHDASQWVVFSGTKVRSMLQEGKMPPPEFTRPEVAEVLIQGIHRLERVS